MPQCGARLRSGLAGRAHLQLQQLRLLAAPGLPAVRGLGASLAQLALPASCHADGLLQRLLVIPAQARAVSSDSEQGHVLEPDLALLALP